jgi:predicted O-methyltransferase YrrM
MSTRTLPLTEALHAYLLRVSVQEDEVQRRLREETGAMAEAHMQIAPEQAQLLQFLVRLIGARRCLEVGTFTGYSALAVALALPDDGVLTCCDVSKPWTDIAWRYWQQAGVGHKIFLRLAPAAETLDALLAEGLAGSYDFAFIDADKRGYARYFESALELVRTGGLIAIDNTLWYGYPADPERLDPDTVAIRAFNEHLKADPRIDLALVPVGDGLTLARRR